MMDDKIKLVPLEQNNPDHLTLMYTVRTHPDVDKHLCGPPPANFSAHVRYLAEAVKNGKKLFFLICYEEHLCGYCHVTFQDEILELGWALHPDWWRKGIGKRSIALLIGHLQESGLSEGKVLRLIVKKDNIHASSLYKKSGFVILRETENQEYLMQYQDL